MQVLMILSCVVATCLAQQGYNYQNQPQSNLNFAQQTNGQVQVAFNAIPEQQVLQQGSQVQIKFNPNSQEQSQITFNSASVPASTPVTLNAVSPNHGEAQRAYLPPVSQQNNANVQFANNLQYNTAAFPSATSAALNTAPLATNNVAESFSNARSALRAYLPPVQQQLSFAPAPPSYATANNAQAPAALVNSHSVASSPQLNQAVPAAPLNQDHQHPLQPQQPPLPENHQTSKKKKKNFEWDT